jgi:hypothetical protein
MKNIAIRSFVLALAVVGFSASSIASAARTTNGAKTGSAQPTVVLGNVPAPACSHGYCNMD